MALKRVNKEIQDFIEKPVDCFKNLNLTLIKCDTSNENYLEIFDKNLNKTLLRLIIPNDYPFKPYRIFFFHLSKKMNYSRFVSLLNTKNNIFDPKVLKFFFMNMYNIKKVKFLELNDCYCCSSYTCPINWCPAFTIKNLLYEYLEISFITKYSKPYNYLLLENIYYNLFEKIPDELIDNIIKT